MYDEADLLLKAASYMRFVLQRGYTAPSYSSHECFKVACMVMQRICYGTAVTASCVVWQLALQVRNVGQSCLVHFTA